MCRRARGAARIRDGRAPPRRRARRARHRPHRARRAAARERQHPGRPRYARVVNTLFRVGGDEYDNFMGRYSRVLAPLFADFAGVSSGLRALDVGAGTGALTAELVARGASVAAADPSPEFVTVLRERFPNLEVEEAPAESLPFGAGVFDVALAQLVVAFMSDAPAAIAEMARVARR